MDSLKDNFGNFIQAGKELSKSLINESQKLVDTHIKPKVDNVMDDVRRSKVRQQIEEQKAAPVQQDKSKRKYHKGS